MRRLLEIAADGVGSALAAQAGGADRVELFADLASGGLTPSHATLAISRDRVRLPLFVLIRPRAGDFLYGGWEADVMLRDIQHCRALGMDGVVLGALTAEGEVDVALCRELVAAAGGLPVTFHRAFDAARDLPEALETVIGLGCARVLSSGGHGSAVEGADVLAGMVQRSAGRIGIIAGAGLAASNIADVAQRSGCTELHASAKALKRSAMGHHNRALSGLALDHQQSDATQVAALRAALDALPDWR